MRFPLAGLAPAALSLALAHAAPIEDFKLPGVVYDNQIETPDQHFGFGLGEAPIRLRSSRKHLQSTKADVHISSYIFIGVGDETHRTKCTIPKIKLFSSLNPLGIFIFNYISFQHHNTYFH